MLVETKNFFLRLTGVQERKITIVGNIQNFGVEDKDLAMWVASQ